MSTEAQRILNYTGDAVSAGAIVGAFIGFLPALAALGGILWYAIQIYESKTVQKMIRLRRMRQRLKRLTVRTALIQAASDAPAAATPATK